MKTVLDKVPCTLYLGCVPPLLEVALRKFFPLLSVFCSCRPCCSLPLHDVIFPSHFGSAPRSSSFPHLPLCCAYCPPIVLHSCHMSSPSPFCIRYVFLDKVRKCNCTFQLTSFGCKEVKLHGLNEHFRVRQVCHLVCPPDASH